MNTKKINEIFGYGLFIVGALKILLVVLVLTQVGTNIRDILNGGSANGEYYPMLGETIGYAQIVLAIGSILMIVLTIKKQPGVIVGYLWGLGALLIEFVTPLSMAFYAVFVQGSVYMKAGMKIREKNTGKDKNYKAIKQSKSNTEWFYGNGDK